MIPLQLSIKNFLSYGPELQTIEFGMYPLICLSGKNGHGKSALLDAITWALWGQARKISGTSKPDQGLLHLGQTQMMVSLDFICNGKHYRVKREFMQTYGKPVAHLEFGTVEKESGKCIPLTDKTIRGSQEIIETTIHLSYESFINSAYLRQGLSHEFSTKSPKERKEIFAAILGLQEYETVRKYALEKIKQATIQKNSLQLYQEKLSIDLNKKAEISAQCAFVLEQLEQITKQDHKLNEKKTELANNIELWQKNHQQFQLLNYKVQQFNETAQKLTATMLSTRETWRSIRRKQPAHADLHHLDTSKKEFLIKLAQQQTMLQTMLQLKEQLLHHKEQLGQIENKIRQEHQKKLHSQQLALQRLHVHQENNNKQAILLTQEIITKQESLKKIEQEIFIIKKQLEQSPIDEKAHAQQEKLFEKRKNFYHHYRTQGNWITNELTVLRQKQTLTHDEKNPSCPLCEQNLSASRRKFLHQQFAEQEHWLEHRLARFSKLVTSLKEILLLQHAELEKIKQHADLSKQLLLQLSESEKKYHILHNELVVGQKNHAEIIRNATLLATQVRELELLITQNSNVFETMLSADQVYHNVKSTCDEINQKISAITYNANEHETISLKLTHIEHQQAEYQLLQQELALQEHRKQEVFDICAKLKDINYQKALLLQDLKNYGLLQTQAHALKQQQIEITQTNELLRQQRDNLLQQKGSLEIEHQRITSLERQYTEQVKTINTLATDIEDYQTIATATSKDGIQALLIEQALPEIEQEANKLLSKLTNNQAHIIIESLRDLKKGGTKETLDIKISDAAGIRAYEMFSGGEAFRIDFSLRIAISKLLARRAGTALQTLIIDEGFGSQDEDGLSHIMDAMYKIQDDFAKVIIVSHLPAMKENFPVHFYIEKKAQGSMVTVIEQE